MDYVDQIKKIDSSSALFAGLFFFAILGPGLLIVLVFKPSLFIELDVLKLVLLSLSITSPGVIAPIVISQICSVIISKIIDIDQVSLGSPKDWFFRHAMNNAFTLYLLIFLSYIWSWKLSSFLWFFLLHIIGVAIYEFWHMPNRAKNSENPIYSDIS